MATGEEYLDNLLKSLIESEEAAKKKEEETASEDVVEIPEIKAEEEPAASGTQTIEERFPYLNTNAGMTYCMKDESFYLEMIESYVQEDKRELLEKEFAAAS